MHIQKIEGMYICKNITLYLQHEKLRDVPVGKAFHLVYTINT
jgi:hypothetical protein